MNDPQPVRKLLRWVVGRARLGSSYFRYKLGALDRQNYAHLVFQAAQLAASLGHARVSVIELGVAGGAGLLAFEQHADWVEKLFPVKIEVYGFDTGEGLPPPIDYRDLPFLWKAGFYRMDQDALKARLKRGVLVLGDVAETAGTFFRTHENAAPVGAISFDLDFYSSTVNAFKLLDAPSKYFLPRVSCYFDDVLSPDIPYADGAGERLAIREFNARNRNKEFSPDFYLRESLGFRPWHHKIWVFHDFTHPEYCKFVGTGKEQLGLDEA
jgi:hypothetical protein